MISYGEIEGKVLRTLNKSSANRGFYTAEKCYDAIEEAVDAIATEMMLADEGWLTKKMYLDTAAGTITVPLPPSIHMIKEVRYLCGDTYARLDYRDGSGQDAYADSAGIPGFPGCYQLLDNQFYFNPALAEGGARYLEVEYMSYPRMPGSETDVFEQQFDKAMFHLIKYRAATILARPFGKAAVEWAPELSDWQAKVTTIINRRNLQTTTIREFNGS